MSYLARFDPLTGLINRFMFSDRLQGRDLPGHDVKAASSR